MSPNNPLRGVACAQSCTPTHPDVGSRQALIAKPLGWVLALVLAISLVACGGNGNNNGSGGGGGGGGNAGGGGGTNGHPTQPGGGGSASGGNDSSGGVPSTPAPAPAANMELFINSLRGGTGLPFTIGQAFAQGDVPSGQTLLSDTPNFQAVIKNRWPDGSAKFAVLSGHIDSVANDWTRINLYKGTVPAAAPPLATADLKATGITAAIQFGSFGTASWSGNDWDQPAKTWIQGPEMSSWTYRKPIGNDAHLVAWMEVRAYRGGQVEVLPWIENGYLRVANPTEKSGTASFTLGGTQRFTGALDLLNHQRAVLASGTQLTHWLGADPQLTPRQSPAYLMATKLVPNYRATTSATSPLFDRLATSYTPLAQADYPTGMGSGGYHPSIGLLPEWDAAYFSTQGDPRAYRAILINAYAAGRYGIHFRDETTNRPPLFSSYPSLVLDGSSGTPGTGSSTTGSYTPAAAGATPPTYNSTHHPSMGYMAYLLTGWNYFLEENQFVVTTNYLKQPNTIRQDAEGILETTTGSNTTRGAAWATRSLAQAAAITPDDDPLRAQYVHSVNANIAYYYGRYVAQPNNPLGLVQPYSNYDAAPKNTWTSSVWMDDFFTAAYAYLNDLKAYDATNATLQSQLDQFLAWKFRSIIGRLGGSGADQFSYRYAAQYTVPYAPSTTVDWTGAGPWFKNWGEVARTLVSPAVPTENVVSTNGELGQPLMTGYPTEATGYWGDMRPGLSYAVDNGAVGAADAWNRVTSASNFPEQDADYNDNPVWGIKPRMK